MMTAWFFSGASLFALLIVDICCTPLKHAPGYNTNAGPYLGSSQSAPVAAMPYNAPSKGVSEPAYLPAPQWAPSSTQTGVQRKPAPSFGSSSSSGPALSGYGGSSLTNSPASSTQPGAAFQPASGDINWIVAPPSISSVGEMSVGTHGVGSSRPENVSPPLPPPGPVYQAGELSHFEEAFENGDYQRETEEQGLLPPLPPPAPISAGQGFTSQPQPESSIGGSWNIYPHYDYMFLTGQYPPGTVSHYSSSNEQGSNNWEDVHYIRYHFSDNPGPAQQTETFAVPQSFEDPRPPVKRPVIAPYGQGRARGGVSAPSHSRAGGYNPGKGHRY
ncbi:protein PRRC2A-like [Thunnus maccoyii]|uniref:protein PRRC2A-like n=1 Tax=Thunnus maccoyii TaxID=8240 RepID=UPI001C4C402C|nr:protein PRRC2A-like [Thunnus maccoyii]